MAKPRRAHGDGATELATARHLEGSGAGSATRSARLLRDTGVTRARSHDTFMTFASTWVTRACEYGILRMRANRCPFEYVCGIMYSVFVCNMAKCINVSLYKL